MPDYTTERVNQRVHELEQSDPDEQAIRLVPRVWNASYYLEQARNALNLDKHNATRQQSVKDAEQEYNVATNEAWRNLRMAKLEADKAAKRAVVEQAEAARAAQIEARYLESLRPGWLQAGGTDAQLEQEFHRPGGLWAVEVAHRAAAMQSDMTQQRAFRSDSPVRAPAAPVQALPEMVMVEAAPDRTPQPSRARSRPSPVQPEEAITIAHIE